VYGPRIESRGRWNGKRKERIKLKLAKYTKENGIKDSGGEWGGKE